MQSNKIAEPHAPSAVSAPAGEATLACHREPDCVCGREQRAACHFWKPQIASPASGAPDEDVTRVAAIRARLNAATPGPWVAHSTEIEHASSQTPPDCICRGYSLGQTHQNDVTVEIYSPPGTYEKRDRRVSDNAEFIAHARSDMEWLLTRLAAAEREREAMREILREVAYGCDLGTTWLDDYAPTELMERILAALTPPASAPSLLAGIRAEARGLHGVGGGPIAEPAVAGARHEGPPAVAAQDLGAVAPSTQPHGDPAERAVAPSARPGDAGQGEQHSQDHDIAHRPKVAPPGAAVERPYGVAGRRPFDYGAGEDALGFNPDTWAPADRFPVRGDPQC